MNAIATATEIETETEVCKTPASQQCQPSPPALLLLTLDLTFAEIDFAQPHKVRGICCSAKDVWYSNNHWPEDDQCAQLFSMAHETQRMLAPGLEHVWNTVSIWTSFRKKSLASTPYAIELRMAGSRCDTQDRISVRPSVWIRTTDEAIEASAPWKELKRLVKRLGLHSPQYASIYAEGGLRLANNGVAVAKEHLPLDKGITFPGGEALYTHILAQPPRGSACGLLCLTTIVRDGEILEQNLSRIGGLISFKSSRQGVTSGHVMLQHFLGSGSDDSLFTAPGEAPGSDDLGGFYSGSSADESDEDLELIENHQSSNVGQQARQLLGHVDLAGLTQWVSVTPSDTINFVAQAKKDSAQSSTWRVRFSPAIAADFALISGITDWDHDNYYLNLPTQDVQHGVPLGEKKWVSGYSDDASLKSRDVLILVGQESQHIVASLQTTRISLTVGAATFWTRKLGLKAPLGRGTSGAWVVDKISGALCGSIIAVFDGEPCALMLTAQTLFSNISKYTSLAAEQMTSPVVAPPLEHSVQAITASEVPETYPTSPRGKASQPHWEDSFTSDDDDDEQIYSTDPGSSISEDAASATTSISSSIFDYQVINGRTYQDAYGKYWAPNDERACEALDLLHHLCLVILDGKLHRAPLEKKKIRNVLDIGTGTGLWAIDFADEFPEAEVIGIDISPIQPSLVPPNLWFEIDDFTRPWTFPEDSVDYIHMRFLRGSVPDWHALYQNAFRATKPGGWIETHEDNPELHTHEGPLEGDGALAGWGKIFQNGSQKLGRHFTPIPYDLQKNGLLAAGFIDINCQPVQVPIWDWPKNRKLKKMGLMAKASMLVDVEGQISIMADLCGWTSEEITAYCKRFRAELESETAPVFYYQWVVWGRKPEEGEGSI